MVSKLPPDEFDDGDRPGAVIGMAIASISGFIVGILMRGELFIATAVTIVAIIFAFAGWSAKGMIP